MPNVHLGTGISRGHVVLIFSADNLFERFIVSIPNILVEFE